MAKPSALIIEDDAIIATLYEIILEDEEYETEIVYDGQKAMDRLAEVTPKVILLDLFLPFISGNTIFKKIRSDNRFKDTRVVIITSSPQAAASLTGTLGTTILIKPISTNHLRLLIKRSDNEVHKLSPQ